MKKEKIEYYASLVVLILGALALAYLLFAKLFIIVLPFLISWAVAFALRPLSHKIARKTKIPKKWVSLAFTVIVVVGGMALVFSILVYAAREAWSFLSSLAGSEKIYDIISTIMNPLSGIFGEHEGAAEIEARISEAIKGLVSSLLTKFVNFVSDFVTSVPGVIIFLITTVISAVYFSLELDIINAKVKAILPEKIGTALVGFKNKFLVAGIRYLRSYLTIMLVVFFILLLGFLVLGVDYALLLAVVFALLDLLPLIGIGTFMLPWAIFQIAFGSFGLGVGLIVLFVVTELVRNLIEPKILGKNLGIHPLMTLILLYASYSLFGLFGLFLLPFLTVILNIAIDKNNSAKVE